MLISLNYKRTKNKIFASIYPFIQIYPVGQLDSTPPDFWHSIENLCHFPQSDFSKSWNFTWSEKISSKLSDFTFADLFHMPSGCYRKNFRIDWELSGFVKLSLFKICFLLYNVQNPIFYLVVRNTIHFVDALSGDSRDQAKLGSILRIFPSLLLLLRMILILYRYSYIRRML